ncbi:transposase, MuDR, MULE transposase domain protein, partial [Tanacetum coccineum]
MACSVPHTYDEIKVMVDKQIKEDKVRQQTIMNLAMQCDHACTVKDDLRNAYENCNDIPQEIHDSIVTFLKGAAEKYYEMHNSLKGAISCQCRKWQLLGIPCGHVIAVTRFLGLTNCVQFVADWFKKEKYQGTCVESIHFVRDMHEWELPSHIHPAIPPRMDNPQPGRPKNTNRILSQ